MIISIEHTDEDGNEIIDIYNMNFVKAMRYYKETNRLIIGYTDGNGEILYNVPNEEFNRIKKWLYPYL